jgi:prolyl oligopeptidase
MWLSRRPPKTRFLIAAALGVLAAPGWLLAIDYPQARKVDQVDDFGGTKIADPYRWLETIDDPAVQAWVDAENQLTHGYLDHLQSRPAIVKRLTELFNYPRFGLPQKHGGWLFFTKNDGLQNQSVLYREKGLEGKPEVLLDPNVLAADGTVALGEYEFTPDGALMAYALHQSGSDWAVIQVRDVASGKDRQDKLERVRFTSIAWAPDKSGFYYSRYNENEEHSQKLCFHRLGDPQSKDRVVYERPEDGDLGFNASMSDDGRFLVVQVWKGTASENEIFVQRWDGKNAGFEPLFTGFKHNFDFVESAGDRLYFETDKDAPRRRLVAVDMTDAAHTLAEVIPQQPADVLQAARITNGRFAVSYLHNAHNLLRTYALDGSAPQEIALPTLGSITGPAGSSGLSGSPKDPDLFIGFTSFLFPTQNYRVDFTAGKLVLFQKAELKFDPSGYVTRQVFYESKDGTKVPMFLVHRRGLRLDGENPVLLYAYGGFNISLTPSFSATRLFWLEQGGVYAVPNLRGGGEFGEDWHRAGMLEKKQNVFDDYIGAAEWLIANDYTRPGRLAIEGGSNGGLLTAACTLQRPDLYGAVLSLVPVTDMLRYQKFTIGSYWMPEYGDPEKPDQFKFLIAYSPVHNVKPGAKYPAMLITTADTDTRVHPAHAKKFAAAMQAANTSANPILLRVETKAGHGQGKPTTKQIEERADLYGFVMDRLGMQVAPAGGAVMQQVSPR